ncbi:uncharacterized protein LOC124454469 [Xenia sp. Carnegie-2017]|uniref:uncharacterized protein LOC124454469 n=1 Tax=Xenia sp. Carnegie-2017 TaxID=2897299 RepID=UPI001F038048|nr:uncharacterized protein LOC124454469 [Xenia sp. Carnegie-2017]
MMDESSRLNSVGDIGVALAEEARRIGQQLKVNSQSAKYSNLDRPKSVPRTSNFTENSPRETGNSVRGVAQENQRENADMSQEDDFGQENNSLTDGILMEQLAGIQGAIEAMENPGLNDDEEDSLSLLMNVMESGDLGNLSDMPWNLV